MLVRSLKASPSLFLFLVFCVLLGWQLSGGIGFGDPIPASQPAPPPPPPPEAPPPPKEEPPKEEPKKEEPPKDEPPPPPPPPPPPKEEEPPKPDTPRIALVTFVTDQRSYIQLSLKNKDRKPDDSPPSQLQSDPKSPISLPAPRRPSNLPTTDYARRHNYTFLSSYEAHAPSPLGPTWWKLSLTHRLISSQSYDWIWFLDFDTLITNTTIPLITLISETLANTAKPDEIDWLKTHDCNGLNTGSYIVRSTPRALKFIEDIFSVEEKSRPDREEGHGMSEQDAMAELLRVDKEAMDRTLQVPQWKLNAFPAEIACFDEDKKVWEPGMFVLHFAGAWAHVKGEDPTGQLMKKYERDIIWGDWKEFY
jgi:mannan polymerase II complex MNN10 subunit